MTGRELAVRNGIFDLRMESARAKLRDVWNKGHLCVELRDVPKGKTGKRIIFFCTLCLCRCFSDDVLDAHLQGNLHRRRSEFAKSTLFVGVPWPFNDGLLFFFQHPAKVEELLHPKVTCIPGSASGGLEVVASEVACITGPGGDLEVVSDGPKFADNRIVVSGNDHAMPLSSNDKSANNNNIQMISGVLIDGQVSDLEINLMGIGCISARLFRNDEAGDKIGRIWCAWLGEEDIAHQEILSTVPNCDVAIVIFSYACDLGRKRTIYESNLLTQTDSYLDYEDVVGPSKRRKCSSDPEDIGCLTECDSSSEDGPNSNGIVVEAEVSKDFSACHAPKLISTKAARQELRRWKRLTAEKTCDLCQHPMLPGKDAATLLNVKTGNLFCSSRNSNGAFHTFHISCLMHWILVCESELQSGNAVKARRPRGRKGKNARNAIKKHISSILCPECQGTGIVVNQGQLESPTISLEKMFKCKLKARESHRNWSKDHETLEKSSTGLRFCPKEPLEDNVLPMKLLKFYRAET